MVAQGPLEALVMVRVHAGQPIFPFLNFPTHSRQDRLERFSEIDVGLNWPISSVFIALKKGYIFRQPESLQAMFEKASLKIGARTKGLGLLISGIVLPSLAEIAAKTETAEEAVDFARQILPILSDKCFVCHGPDAKKEDFLRLDSFAGATEDRGGYQAVNPQAPEESELLTRIYDADDPMPPADAEKQLTEKERELLSRWVRQGGQYAKHWAFVPPQKNKPPLQEGVRGSIDAFLAAAMEKAGVDFAPEADKAVLARRASLVLTGLPPEPERLADFLADERPGAYERFVEERLASPRYGEHQARYWLDAVRYGDTHGLHLDNRRGIYPYRDWVVNAFNENRPLDDFITWQLAGDLLPNSTLEQELATGFVRMNPTTGEGGAIPLEFQAKNNFDRTETLGTVFLGLTLSCARCHTHKYDPITQTEYYRLFAFFNNTAEHSMDGNAYAYGPVVKVPENPADWPDWKRFLKKRSDLLRRAAMEKTVPPSALVEFAKPRAEWKAGKWKQSPILKAEATFPKEEDWEEAKGLPGAIPKSSLPKPGKALWLSFEAQTPEKQTLWLRFAGGAGSAVFINREEVSLPFWEQGQILAPLLFSKGTHHVHLKIAGSSAGGPIRARLENPWDAVAKAGSLKTSNEEKRLLLLADPAGPFHKLGQSAALRLAQEYATKEAVLTTSLIARDLAKPRETKVLRRGEYHLPIGDALQPGVPSIMGTLPENAPRNRLGLAQWLTSKNHPTVSRVLINRVWQRTFGHGLARSPEDFGVRGEYPTHPKLLDWLAVELQESGWNLKHMLRLMVRSRAFRQSSKRRPEVNDPENRLFARGPSHRLDAETLRDIGLWAGGMLDSQMGGEGVKPYQPAGLWSALAHPASNTKRYLQDKGRRLYRRSLYVYWKRTSPHPMMTLFDAPSREASCVRRSRTNTPLQSLGLLNETQRVEMGRMLGERLLRERADDAGRLDLLFALLASRPPTHKERTACLRLLDQMKQRYQQDEEAAAILLAIGEAAGKGALNVAEHAAWTQVASTALASDAAILNY